MDDQTFHQELNRGARLLAQGKPDQARAILECLRQLRPDHSAVAINLGGAYILGGQFKRAVPILESLAEREPDNAMVWTNLGAAYLGNPVLATTDGYARQGHRRVRARAGMRPGRAAGGLQHRPDLRPRPGRPRPRDPLAHSRAASQPARPAATRATFSNDCAKQPRLVLSRQGAIHV